MEENKQIVSHKIDIIIPVYNEGAGIRAVLELLECKVNTPFRVLICYDFDGDSTLPIINSCSVSYKVMRIKNCGKGVHSAIITGFEASDSDCVIVFPADDIQNQGMIDEMYAKFKEGCDIVVASRFTKGGSMKGCPLLKAVLVRGASYSLYWLGGTKVRDATNGFRLFSRRVLERIKIESTEGFAYSLELLAKCERLGWRVGEIPAQWVERTKGRSRFKVAKWIPKYLKWYFFALKTTWFHKKPETVILRDGNFNR